MKEKRVKLVNACPVFPSKDVGNTVKFYIEKLGFKSATHYEKIDNFATLYRDEIEFVIVQSQYGEIESNAKRYGAGFDAYIDTDTVEGIDILYQELLENGVTIVSKPRKTDYGSYEFVAEDCDGRLIGFGLIFDKQIYFKNSDILNK